MNTLLYIITFFSLWWCYQGYFLYLYLFRERKPDTGKIPPASSGAADKFSLIVLTFNEPQLIKEKIENLRRLTYKNYEVYFADASDDNTPQIILDSIQEQPNYKLIKTKQRGRSMQLNEVLPSVSGDIIFITDVDSVLPADTLECLLEEFSDEKVAVAGAYVTPTTAYKNDILFWQSQNIMRRAESLYGHCPVASGAAYAWRRDLLHEIPADVWADDIYMPFFANLKGFKCVYSGKIAVDEVRAPADFRQFYKVKIRKAHDNIRELLRFLPKIFKMKFRWLVVYATRFTQVIILPLLIWLFLLLLFSQNISILTGSALLIFAAGLLQLYVIGKISPEKREFDFFSAVKIFILTNIILLTALLKYIFFKEKVQYSK